MKSLDLNSTNFLIIVGSFNNEYNLGFNLYQLNPAEKAIVHKNQNIEAITIHFQFSNNKRFLYSACASGEDEGKISTFKIGPAEKEVMQTEPVQGIVLIFAETRKTTPGTLPNCLLVEIPKGFSGS